MLTFSIQSGSNGNCIYYESGSFKFLFDSGIPFSVLKERLIEKGINPSEISALFISHDHSDHSKSVGVFQRKLKIPVFISPKTFRKIEYKIGAVDQSKIHHFTPNDTIDFGSIKVQTIRTPHDGIEPSVFVIDDGQTKVGVLTDLGYCFTELLNVLWELDVVYLESNYDLTMLKNNREYPDYLKRRIVGNGGHINNLESANLVKNYCDDKLKYLILSHLSENNNTPAIALESHHSTYKGQNDFKMFVAPRNTTSKEIYL